MGSRNRKYNSQEGKQSDREKLGLKNENMGSKSEDVSLSKKTNKKISATTGRGMDIIHSASFLIMCCK